MRIIGENIHIMSPKVKRGGIANEDMDNIHIIQR